MQSCLKYETKISGCSKQVSLFAAEVCERCLEKKTLLIDPRKEESVIHWKEEFGIETGMPKEEAFDRFRGWRESKRTCQRCAEKNYSQFCSMSTICKESEEVIEDVVRDDNRTRAIEVDEPQTLRTQLSEARKRDAIRQSVENQEGLS